MRTLTIAEYFSIYISSIKGKNWYPTPIFYNDKQVSTDSEKAQLSTNTFIQYTPPVNSR